MSSATLKAESAADTVADSAAEEPLCEEHPSAAINTIVWTGVDNDRRIMDEEIEAV